MAYDNEPYKLEPSSTQTIFEGNQKANENFAEINNNITILDSVGTAATQPTSRFPYVVGSVAELASVPEGLRVDGQAARIAVGGRAGDFTFSTADLSAEVAADTQQGIYVAPFGQTGSLGAWVRDTSLGIVTPEMFGSPDSGENSEIYFNEAANAGLKIVGKRGKTYIFKGQVSITKNFEFDANHCDIVFGDGHLNLFNLVANVDFVKIRNVLSTTVMGVTLGDFVYKNFYSAFEDAGTIIGFPTGEKYYSKVTEISNNSIGPARVFCTGDGTRDTKLIFKHNVLFDEDYVIRPCSLLASSYVLPRICKNEFYGNYHEDIVKISNVGPDAKIVDNTFRQNSETGPGQIDVYSSFKGCLFKGNTLHNAQYHKKQTGGEGASIDVAGLDKVIGNTFYTDKDYRVVYWRGFAGVFSGNTFEVDFPQMTETRFLVHFDNEVNPLDVLGGDTQAQGVMFSNNVCVINGALSFPNTNVGWIDSPQSFSENSARISVIGNTLHGGNFFVRNEVAAFVGNEWVSGVGGGDIIIDKGPVAANTTPPNTATIGSVNYAHRREGEAEGSTLDADKFSYFRITGGPTINEILGGFQGDTITIYARTACTVQHIASSIELQGSASWNMPDRSSLVLQKATDGDGWWHEISRTSP